MAKKTYIMIIRHAKAYKNEVGIIGGSGSKLIDEAYVEINKFYEKFKYFFSNNTVTIYTTKKQQLLSTAIELNRLIRGKMMVYDYISPLKMGVFDGMTEIEAKQKYPKEYELLSMWRKKEIDISMLNIPGMGSYFSFWDQGVSFLNEIEDNTLNIAVCSTSVFILLANIMLNHSVYRDGEYKCIDVQTMDYLTFIKEKEMYELIESLSSDSVVSEVES